MKSTALLSGFATLLIITACAGVAITSTPVLQPTVATAQPTEIPTPTPNIEATVEAGVRTAIAATLMAAQPATPTLTAAPTSTPTFQPTPTGAPLTTPTLFPTTAAPIPTGVPPQPTATPIPTSTPVPTAAPLPTATPIPTATPSPIEAPLPTPTPTAIQEPTPTATLAPSPTATPTHGLSVTLSANSSGKASNVTVTGHRFTPNGTATVKYDGINVTIGRTDREGTFDTSFEVPIDTTYGVSYRVETIDNATGLTVSVGHRVSFPILTLEPAEGFPGAPLNIIGQDFPAFAFIRPIVFDGIDVSPYPYISTEGSGSFKYQLAIPKVAGPDVTVSAKAGAGVAVASFKVLPPTVVLTPPVAVPNTNLVVNGWNFPASTDIEALSISGLDLLSDAENVRVSLVLETTVWGSFELLVKVPILSPGDAEVIAEVAGTTASTMLAIPPIVIDLTPPEGHIFSPLKIKISGLPASTPVTDLNIGGIPILKGTRDTDANGTFELTTFVPPLYAGPAQVSVTAGTTTSTTDFIVTP